MSTNFLLDRLGAELFGRPARLVVALWVEGRAQEVFWQQLIARETGLPAQYVRSEIVHLCNLGMIEPAKAGVPGDRRKFYRRTDSPYWRIISVARGTVEDGETDASSHART